MATAQDLDEERINAFVGKSVGEFGVVASAALVVIGDRLGLYRALAEGGPQTPAELAARTGTVERYVREWLLNQAASGNVNYNAEHGRYALPAEHVLTLVDENSPAFMVGGYQVMTAAVRAIDRIAAAFRDGSGLAWGDQHPDLFQGTERFFRPGYIANLTQSWIPALEGVHEKLTRGGTVADVGTGHGASTIVLAKAYPNSRFAGFDNHAPSIETARQAARAAGLGARVTFEVAPATDFPGSGYDLVAFFDCLHDRGNPAGAAAAAYRALADDGSVLLVEPMAGHTPEENLNPVGRVFSAASALICTPHAIAEGGQALGTLATDEQLAAIFHGAGFRTFRRATETPFNRIFEARK
jgi:SAM-dependent methyltransferase